MVAVGKVEDDRQPRLPARLEGAVIERGGHLQSRRFPRRGIGGGAADAWNSGKVAVGGGHQRNCCTSTNKERNEGNTRADQAHVAKYTEMTGSSAYCRGH